MSYSLDFEASNCYYLGELCVLKHDWRGTGYSLRHRKTNQCKECKRLHRINYRTRKRASQKNCKKHIPIAKIDARIKQFNYCCAYCQIQPYQSIDHFIALGEGGKHSINNILPACIDCNYSKQKNEPINWYRRQSFYSAKQLVYILNVLGLDIPLIAIIDLGILLAMRWLNRAIAVFGFVLKPRHFRR